MYQLLIHTYYYHSVYFAKIVDQSIVWLFSSCSSVFPSCPKCLKPNCRFYLAFSANFDVLSPICLVLHSELPGLPVSFVSLLWLKGAKIAHTTFGTLFRSEKANPMEKDTESNFTLRRNKHTFSYRKPCKIKNWSKGTVINAIWALKRPSRVQCPDISIP